MKIGIVLHPYGEEKPAGLGRAIFEITRGLIEFDSKNEYVVFLRKRPKIPLGFKGQNWRIKIGDPKFFWLDRALRGENLDVCIFNTPIISFFVKPKKSIVIAYDFAYDNFSPDYLLKLYHRFSLKAADLIISISEATKKEIVSLFRIPCEKIMVIYLGYDKICGFQPYPPPGLPEKFFLFVGAIKERKNVYGIVKAFSSLKSEKRVEPKLVLAGHGKGQYYEKIIRFVKENGLSEKVIFLGQVSDGELSYLYRRAEALVYPSFIEGFGLPILEAMSCGLPVITSTVSSLPEVAGGAALLVDPYDTEAIAEAMVQIIGDPVLRERLIAAGYKQAEKFSWEKTAAELLYLISGKGYDRAV